MNQTSSIMQIIKTMDPSCKPWCYVMKFVWWFHSTAHNAKNVHRGSLHCGKRLVLVGRNVRSSLQVADALLFCLYPKIQPWHMFPFNFMTSLIWQLGTTLFSRPSQKRSRSHNGSPWEIRHRNFPCLGRCHCSREDDKALNPSSPIELLRHADVSLVAGDTGC